MSHDDLDENLEASRSYVLQMMTQEALELVSKILEPKRLTYIQEIVFVQSWSGKIYREIAAEAGYDLDYIKEVGAQLWGLLSEALGEKVTKKNIKLILTQAVTPGGTLRLSGGASEGQQATDVQEFPSGAVPLYSNLYILRPPLEERALAEMMRLGSLVRIRAPRHMGKTSLLVRMIAHARQVGYRTLTLNFQQADSRIFRNLNQFLRWFCVYVSHRLNLEPRLDDYWDDEIGSKVSCTTYFQEYVLHRISTPLVIAIDELNRIFEYPELAQDFLPLLRTWHEEAAEHPIWQKLRLVVAHSTDIYIPLSLNQSPFNVGLPVQLPCFTLEQAQDLAHRYGLEPTAESAAWVVALWELVGGHPYLLRLALHGVTQQGISYEGFLESAATQAGLYSHYLRQLWDYVNQRSSLMEAVISLLDRDWGQVDAISAYQLEGLGLITLQGNHARIRCDLYRHYFRAQLSQAVEHPQSR